jgi:copper homeostasis protein
VRILLEISVDSSARAAAAERAGADRIELCSALEVGGLTPGPELLGATRDRLKIPVFSMVRQRSGDFVYSDQEIQAMGRQIRLAKRLGMDGVVFGLLTPDGRVDAGRTRELVQEARPLTVTFHRAFDQVRHLAESLDDVIATGATRVLTSGGMPSALEGVQQLQELVRLAAGRITVLPGAGIHAGNVEALLEKCQAREVHAGLSSVVRRSGETESFQAEVSKLAQRIARFPGAGREPGRG